MSSAAARTLAAFSRRDLSARGVVVGSAAAMAVVIALDLLDGHLGLLFSLGFVLVVATAPLSVVSHSLFTTAVLPPVLLVASLAVVAVVARSAIEVDGLPDSAGAMGTLLGGVIDRGVVLLVGEALALLAVGLRLAARRH